MTQSARRWACTINNPTDDTRCAIDGLVEATICTYVCYGVEVAPTTGTRHLQCYFVFDSRVTLGFLRDVIGNHHFEVCRGTHTQNVDYCKKAGEWFEYGVPPAEKGQRSDWEDVRQALAAEWLTSEEMLERWPHLFARYRSSLYEFRRRLSPRQDFGGDLREWQSNLERQLLVAPDDRSILFVVDEVGNQGKTWFQKYMCSKYSQVQLLLTGKRDDMCYAVDEEKTIFLINVPRNGMQFLQYTVLEMLKDGIVHSPKYESVTKFLRKCHVVVFCNEYPDMLVMTQDRYLIFNEF